MRIRPQHTVTYESRPTDRNSQKSARFSIYFNRIMIGLTLRISVRPDIIQDNMKIERLAEILNSQLEAGSTKYINYGADF